MKIISTIVWLLAIVAISTTTTLIVVRVSTQGQGPPQANLKAPSPYYNSDTFLDTELAADPLPIDPELERLELEAIKRELNINIFQDTLFDSADEKLEEKEKSTSSTDERKPTSE